VRFKVRFLENYIDVAKGNSYPYFMRWVQWCWHRPVYLGLPLIPLFVCFMFIDFLLLIAYVIIFWGRL
jgi:hypothetical protein